MMTLFPAFACVVVLDPHEPSYEIVPASFVLNVKDGVFFFVGVGTGVTIASVGSVLSIVKDGTARMDEIFPAASVTFIVQFVYVPSTSVLKVIVLFPEVADVVAEEQEPPYVIVPASVVENVTIGVVLLDGVGTAVTIDTVGAVVSITKVGTERTEEIFPATSVIVIVQFEYVPAASVANVIVLFPDVADVVAEEQEPPYVIVPASVVENVYDGVVFFVGVGTAVTVASDGAVVSMTMFLFPPSEPAAPGAGNVSVALSTPVDSFIVPLFKIKAEIEA
jgi:chorismate mutase